MTNVVPMSIGMPSSFSRLSWAALRQRRSRSILTATGVTLGVALFFGALISNASGLRAMSRRVEVSAGSADAVITPVGDIRQAVLDGGIEPKVTRLPGISSVVGVIGFPTTVSAPSGRSLALKYNHPNPAVILGVDLDDAQRVFPVRFEAGRGFASGRDEALIPARLAAKLRLAVGSRATVSTPRGDRRVVIVGVLANSGAGLFNQGRAIVTSLATARSMVGRTGAVTQIFVDLRDGIDAQRWIKDHGATIGRGVTVEAPSEVGGADFLRRQLAAAGALLNVLGATLLFVSGFLIYLTHSTSVVERVRLYGTLRSLGARRSQVRRLVVTEALIIGGAATVVGLALGLGVAAGLMAASRRFLENIDLGSTPFVVTPTAPLAAIALGIVTTLVSALRPARRAARLDPVEAIRGDYGAEVRLSRVWMIGVVSFVVGAGLLISGVGVASTGIVAPLFLFGSVTLVPLVLRPLARLIGFITARIAKGVGNVAVLHLAKERTRSGYTLALVMVVMAAAIAIRATHDSYGASLDRQIERELRADFVLGSASTFPPGFSQQVQSVPGVDVVTPFAIARSELLMGSKSEPAQARFIDPARHWETGEFVWREGGLAQARPALERGGSVIFPFSTAQRLGLRRGDFVTMTTGDGPKRFQIAATAEISNSTPSVYFSWREGHLFGVSNPSFLYVTAKPGANLGSIRSKIEDDLGSRTTLLVATLADIKKDVHAQIAGGLNSFFVLLILAGLLGLFGLTNTMAVSMLQRYREIGLLRAIGARKRQVRAMALVESFTLVTVAFLLAVPIGSFLSYPLVKFASRVVGDITVHYVFPWRMIPVLVVAGGVAAAVTAIGPARRATQLEIETALRFE